MRQALIRLFVGLLIASAISIFEWPNLHNHKKSNDPNLQSHVLTNNIK